MNVEGRRLTQGNAFPADSGVADILAVAGGHSVVVIESRVPIGSGTLPKEVVHFVADGQRRSVVCKYAAARGASHGHRHGTLHEARVYRRVLEASDLTVPKLIGSGLHGGRDWLAIEWLEGYQRLSEDPGGMQPAAAWLARFHSEQAQRVSDPALAFLPTYDHDYYAGWALRTVKFAAALPEKRPWLTDLSEYFLSNLALLLDGEPTVVHGEFTIHNVMVAPDVVKPIDWESAAIGPGEIDLMCLIDRWDDATKAACITAYLDSRLAAAPMSSQRRLMAELYLHFRWLGEDPELMLGPKRAWRLDRLAELSGQVAGINR